MVRNEQWKHYYPLRALNISQQFHSLWPNNKYCHALCMGLPLEISWKVQLVQNAIACVLVGTSRWDHITSILWDLYCLLISFHAQFQVLIINYKTLYSLELGYLKDRSPPLTSNPCTMFIQGGSFVCPASQQGSAGRHEQKGLLSSYPMSMQLPTLECPPGSIFDCHFNVRSW